MRICWRRCTGGIALTAIGIEKTIRTKCAIYDKNGKPKVLRFVSRTEEDLSGKPGMVNASIIRSKRSCKKVVFSVIFTTTRIYVLLAFIPQYLCLTLLISSWATFCCSGFFYVMLCGINRQDIFEEPDDFQFGGCCLPNSRFLAISRQPQKGGLNLKNLK